MSVETGDQLQIEVVEAAVRKAALQLIFAGLGRSQRDVAVAESLRAIRSPATAQHRIFAARKGTELVGAIWLENRPGRVASLWPPGLADEQDRNTACQLIEQALAHAKELGTIVVQTLVPDKQCPQSQWICACGFQHTTDVLCMVCDADRFPRQAPESELTFDSFRDVEEARWKSMLCATYEGSQDCPQMQNIRTIDDVLTSYRSAGRFDHSHWLLAQHDGRDIGCALLTEHFNDDWELSYLGVVPEARGRGFGLALIRQAQWLAAQAKAPHLTLAVDAGNAPAISVYSAAGFKTQQPSSVFSRVLGPPGAFLPPR